MKIKRILAAAAALALTTGCLDLGVLYRNSYDKPVEPKHREMPEITSFADDLHGSEWYDDFCEYVYNNIDGFRVDGELSSQDVYDAMDGIENDYPEVFWMGDRYGVSRYDGYSIINISPEKSIDEDDIWDMYADLMGKAYEIVVNAPEGSDYEKVRYVHDYIAENTVYDHDVVGLKDKGMSKTAYGCLVNGKAICTGYSAAFSLLMSYLGIESGICTNPKHAWNWVKIDGEYYWVDVTWDDRDYEKFSASHVYFLLDDEELLRGRDVSERQFFVPECGGEKSWFTPENGCFSAYDRDEVLGYVGSRIDELHCELTFSDFATYAEALDDLFGRLSLRLVKKLDMSKMTYIRSDELYHIDIIFKGKEVTGDKK